MRALVNQDFDTANEFVAAYNKARLQNKNQWISYLGDVAGKRVRIKSYDTTNQILDVDGIKHGGTYDLSVAQWKQEIVDAINHVNPIRNGRVRKNPLELKGSIAEKIDQIFADNSFTRNVKIAENHVTIGRIWFGEKRGSSYAVITNDGGLDLQKIDSELKKRGLKTIESSTFVETRYFSDPTIVLKAVSKGMRKNATFSVENYIDIEPSQL